MGCLSDKGDIINVKEDLIQIPKLIEKDSMLHLNNEKIDVMNDNKMEENIFIMQDLDEKDIIKNMVDTFEGEKEDFKKWEFIKIENRQKEKNNINKDKHLIKNDIDDLLLEDEKNNLQTKEKDSKKENIIKIEKEKEKIKGKENIDKNDNSQREEKVNESKSCKKDSKFEQFKEKNNNKSNDVNKNALENNKENIIKKEKEKIDRNNANKNIDFKTREKINEKNENKVSIKEDNDSIKEEIEGIDLDNQNKVKEEKEMQNVVFKDDENSISNNDDSIKEEIEGCEN